jgi:predicted translin family RNA/ssDNA-binding protein
MDKQTKESNIAILRDIVREAQQALDNMREDEIDEVQQNFIQIESIVQDLQI